MSLGVIYPVSVTALRQRVAALQATSQDVVVKTAKIGQEATSKLRHEATTALDKIGDLVTDQYDRITTKEYEHLTTRKTVLQLIRLSAAVCGIEFCYAAETAFVSPILLKLGVPVYFMTFIWCLSPMLGFFLVPLLGSMSDRCRSFLGRRRPFILLLSVGIIIGLILVPNGQRMGDFIGDSSINDNITSPAPVQANFSQEMSSLTNVTTATDTYQYYRHKRGVVLTILGVVLLDFNADANQSPCRAYLIDVTVPADHAAGLSTFTIMAGLGGSMGYLLGGINWGSTSLGENLGGHVHVVFTLVLVVYIICVIATVTSFKEMPLDEMGVGVAHFQGRSKRVGSGKKFKKLTNEDDDEDVDDEDSVIEDKDVDKYLQHTNYDARETSNKDFEMASHGYQNSETNNQYNLPQVSGANQASSKTNVSEIIPERVSIKTYLKSIIFMPNSMRFLCLTNLFCWMSLVCYSLYFTDFVGQAVFGGNPGAPSGSTSHLRYEHGVRTGCWGMALYSASCSLYSFLIERLIKRFGARKVYICSQLVYTVGAMIMAASRNVYIVTILSCSAGVMYATLFTMPYLLIAQYHCNNTHQQLIDGETNEQQIRGIGTDVAIVSSMVFLAQFILSAAMGSIVHATGTTAAVMVCASVLSFCGAVSATQVLYVDL